jgi:septum formation protein
LARKLATQKAREIASLPVAKGKAVLGADTIVALDSEVLGKPKDEVDAKRMLTALSDREHGVYTGVCFIGTHHGERVKFTDFACTKVLFERLTSEQIDKYIQSGSPMDKAGAYGIQDGGLVKSITGSYSNVVGLPVELCKTWLERIEKLR